GGHVVIGGGRAGGVDVDGVGALRRVEVLTSAVVPAATAAEVGHRSAVQDTEHLPLRPVPEPRVLGVAAAGEGLYHHRAEVVVGQVVGLAAVAPVRVVPEE